MAVLKVLFHFVIAVEDLPPSYDEAVKQSSAVAQQEVADKALDAAVAKLQKM